MNHIVLVRPHGPRNVGSVVRLIANFGPARLTLVRPKRPSILIHPDFTQMGHGAEDVVERVVVANSLEETLADCTKSYGFTARVRDHRVLSDWRAIQGQIIERAADPQEGVAFVFGSEENGLTGAEADCCHELVRMPTSEEHTSLNLAMTVGIVLSTLFFAEAPSARSDGSTPLPTREREFLVQHLSDSLAGLTTSDSARRDLVASIQRVFTRAELETRDARAWHLLARALGSKKTPNDYGLQFGAAGEGPD